MKRVLSAGDVASSLMDDNSSDIGGAFTQPRGRRKKARNGTSATNKNVNESQHSAQSTASIQPTQCSQSTQCPGPSTSSEFSLMQNKVDELLCTVAAQQETIRVLSNRLNFVLSFLNICDNPEQLDGELRTTDGVTSAGSSQKSPVATPTESLNGSLNGRPVQPRPPSSSVIIGAQADRSRRLPSSFREIVAEAISADQKARERRARSVIVTGLAPSVDTSDKLNFKRLCMLELGIEPDIVYTKRLGGNRDGVQPLLIGLQSEQDVPRLLSRAKLLRQSNDENIRHHVFINRNLNKEEARLAYEARCRRRQQQQQRRDRPQQTLMSLSVGATEFVPATNAVADDSGVTDVTDVTRRHR